jgi:hypothetical protein
MNKFSTWMKKALFVLLGALLILSQAGSLGAATVYDRDGDGDSDGFDLYRLISDTGVDLGVDLPDFAYRFGQVDSDGTLRTGWPQLDNSNGYAYGAFNDNAAIADLDGDGLAEVVVPSDVHYICAYHPDGGLLPANAIDLQKCFTVKVIFPFLYFNRSVLQLRDSHPLGCGGLVQTANMRRISQSLFCIFIDNLKAGLRRQLTIQKEI